MINAQNLYHFLAILLHFFFCYLCCWGYLHILCLYGGNAIKCSLFNNTELVNRPHLTDFNPRILTSVKLRLADSLYQNPQQGIALWSRGPGGTPPDSEFLGLRPRNLEFLFLHRVIYIQSLIWEPFVLHRILSQIRSYCIPNNKIPQFEVSCHFGEQSTGRRDAGRKKESFFFFIWPSKL